MSSRRRSKIEEPEVRVVPKVTAAMLQAVARKTQEDVMFMVWPVVLELLIAEATAGKLETVIWLHKLLKDVPVDHYFAGVSLVRELQGIGCAAQVGKVDDDRAWERLAVQVSWKEARA
ncbi:MAG: hypothetical protein Q8M07_08325 [Prosthecobacter sp.]|nr:hypothetical protein [Prosthecobacter sp.]